MDPLGATIGYRQTVNWCCSDYGCSRGYKWVDPEDSKCHDDTFVGTCMFNFIQAGGCDAASLDSNTAIMDRVDDDCFTCDHIGELIDQECMGAAPQSPIRVLNDMVDDARRLGQAPLPAGDGKLRKIIRKISKVRAILQEQKLAARAAMNGGH